MKSIEVDSIEKLKGRKLEENKKFSFKCHKGLACFNKCCRNINLFLYPFDIIRLKNALKISSDEFIEKHVDIVLRPLNFFPDVLLSLNKDEEHTCPFLTESGCKVYEDRPYTCRTFPMEEGLLMDENIKNEKMVYLYRPPDFCLGQHEQQQWTPCSWKSDQKAMLYSEMTAKWAKIKALFHSDPWGIEGPYGAKGKMAFMAAYNVDKFKNFIFKSSFTQRYKVKPSTLKIIKKNDIELMNFGFEFIKFFVWNIKSSQIDL
ncbi:MAG: YkgJ family cysteine cluster protein [Desulfobacterales bacterium]|nr:YkgJ family cysteine cluster protein [Desulfobacterales bacterium]